MTFAVVGFSGGESIYLEGFGISRMAPGAPMRHDVNAQWNLSQSRAILFGTRERAIFVADIMRDWGLADFLEVREVSA